MMWRCGAEWLDQRHRGHAGEADRLFHGSERNGAVLRRRMTDDLASALDISSIVLTKLACTKL
eukprot:894276-Pleurochrysis_carterae.AAC.2